MRPNTPAVFWARVERRAPDECWPWIGKGFHEFGYGKLSYEGKNWNAHKLAWMLTNGPVPEGRCVLHSCDNPPCCNPAHLRPGTRIENRLDCVRKGRHARGERLGTRLHPETVLRGEEHPRRRLSTAQVLEIRERSRRGEPRRALGEHYGVSASTIHRVATRLGWKHVA